MGSGSQIGSDIIQRPLPWTETPVKILPCPKFGFRVVKMNEKNFTLTGFLYEVSMCHHSCGAHNTSRVTRDTRTTSIDVYHCSYNTKRNHWRIQGAPGTQILSFSCSFRQSNRLVHHLRELAPPGKILDPPLGTFPNHLGLCFGGGERFKCCRLAQLPS